MRGCSRTNDFLVVVANNSLTKRQTEGFVSWGLLAHRLGG
jgi:hypothetical protein